MQYMKLIYTARVWNPFSWVIRWGIPTSRFALANSSHVMVDTGEGSIIEAHMIGGVREVPADVALKGAKVVAVRYYPVRSVEDGLAALRSQLCTYEPKLPRWMRHLPKFVRTGVETVMRMRRNNYDFKGAFGMSLAPGRNWQDPSNWHCYELAAFGLKGAGFVGLAEFAAFITETVLLGIACFDAEPVLKRAA